MPRTGPAASAASATTNPTCRKEDSERQKDPFAYMTLLLKELPTVGEVFERPKHKVEVVTKHQVLRFSHFNTSQTGSGEM